MLDAVRAKIPIVQAVGCRKTGLCPTDTEMSIQTMTLAVGIDT